MMPGSGHDSRSTGVPVSLPAEGMSAPLRNVFNAPTSCVVQLLGQRPSWRGEAQHELEMIAEQLAIILKDVTRLRGTLLKLASYSGAGPRPHSALRQLSISG